jgi:hypothetical protein
MIFSENRYPPRIECGAGFFRIMLYRPAYFITGQKPTSTMTRPATCARLGTSPSAR